MGWPAFARLGRLRLGARASFQTLLVNVLILVVNLGAGILTARWLGPDGRGILTALIVWPQFLSYTMMLGLPTAVVYLIKQDPENEGSLVGTALLLGCGISAIVIPVGALVMPHMLHQYDPEIVRIAQWAMLTAPTAVFGLLLLVVVQAREQFSRYNLIRLSLPLMILTGLAGLAAAGAMTPVAAAIVFLIMPFPIVLWNLAWVWRRIRPRLAGAGRSARRLLGYGSRFYGIEILGALTASLDRILLVGLVEPAALGIYVVARGLATPLQMFSGAIVPVLFPKAAALARDDAIAFTALAARLNMMVTGAVAIALAVAAPFIILLLYGEAFMAGVLPYQILILEALLGSMVHVLAQAFMAVGRPGLVASLQLLGLAIAVPLTFLLVPVYGLTGAALALTLASLFRLVSLYVCFPIVLKIRPPRAWPAPADFRALLQPGQGKSG